MSDIKNMNIKSLAPTFTASEVAAFQAKKTSVKTEDSSKDKEGNGKREDGGDQDRSPLTEEELKRALEYLEGLQQFKTLGFKIKVKSIKDSEVKFIIIEDALGKTVRRIPDYEMRQLITDKEKNSGHLLNKAM